MTVLVGPYFAAVVLLGVAGVAKLVRPAPTRAALASVGLPGSVWVVLGLGTAETAVAVAALTVGGTPVALAVAASYAAFAGFVGLALARGGTLRSCGCFGKPDTPPTRIHVVMNVSGAVTAALMATGDAPALPAALAGQPLGGVPLLAVGAVCAWLAYLTLSLLPAVGASVGSRAR